ncbi:aldolase/citrate lyase family protein [Candidatus Dormiibacter inghamiae]|uniref:HpcH/HpaI aldolase family protein n=1 Tax=Candidatus Dormiibacter inghamiae TaxID=3127013 RepID=UPI0030C6BF30
MLASDLGLEPGARKYAQRFMELRRRLRSGRPLLGAWCVIPDSFTAELIGRAGYDWACLDMQHGMIREEHLGPMLQALQLTGTPALVRVPWNEPGRLMKALDAGAEGVIVPMIDSPEDAVRAVQACRYPPAGNRSWGPIRAALGVADYSPATANESVVVTLMIETVGAVQHLDQILSVPGVDAAYVGPQDLSLTHGLRPTPTATEPEHIELIRSVLEACGRHDVVPGLFCGDLESATEWRRRGFRLTNILSDSQLLRQGAAHQVQSLAQVELGQLNTSTEEIRT